MTQIIDRAIVEQALEALEAALSDDQPYIERCKQTITALHAALAQQAEPVQEPQTLDQSMQQPRAMAQIYMNGYNAGAAAEPVVGPARI